LALTNTANAHFPPNYPFAWTYTILSRVFYKANPTSWPGGNWNDRVEDAMAHWNSVSGVPLTFSLAGNAQPFDEECGARNLVRYGGVDGPGGFYGVTAWCPALNSTVEITIDQADAPFDAGASTPNASNKWDVEGVFTHEFGHATRGWLKCVAPDQEKKKDPCEGMHYDPVHNGQICDSSSWGAYSTMCASIPRAESWRLRSLEEHDEDILKSAY
jgi:hypothetical protein